MEEKFIYVLNRGELDRNIDEAALNSFIKSNKTKVNFDALKDEALDSSGNINGTLLLQRLFNSEDPFDIFISYSSGDIKYANKLVAYLEEKTGLSCFTDAIYWETMDKMMDIINNKYEGSYINEEILRKIERNFDHTRVAVTTCLLNIISKCKYFIFIESENSVILKENIKCINKKTASPWINFEINCANIFGESIQHSLDEELEVVYDLDFQNFRIHHNLNDLVNNIEFFECAYKG